MPNEQLMKVLVVSAAGQPFEEDQLARPVPRAGEVLVRIHASGVNPLDSKIRAGEAAHALHPSPAVPGTALAGVVESVGPVVKNVAKGDAVYRLIAGVAGLQGSLAELPRSMPSCSRASRRTSPCTTRRRCRRSSSLPGRAY
jgi:NADPH2:quinone reductase